jgi:hypothetical protein
MNWLLVNNSTGRPLFDRRYLSEHEARADLVRLGETIGRMYRAIPDFHDSRWTRMLFEGFKPGDLEGILLPQFSIDVYVPGDPKTDNVVVGFQIKGVPEAVFPFKNFCEFSRGVRHVDYGDSDTLPHTSIVYVEFDREKFDIEDFAELIDQVCRLSGLKSKDLSVNFPVSNKSYPYSLDRIKKYFASRDAEKNRLAQFQAMKDRDRQIQQELEHELQFGGLGQRLGGADANQAMPPAGTVPALDAMTAATTGKYMAPKGFKRLDKLSRGIHAPKKPGGAGEVPETIKASIIADAQRNRLNHQTPWRDFDSRWAQRLRVSPNKIATIRKRIYEH